MCPAGAVALTPDLAVKAVNAGMTVADIDCPAGQTVREIYAVVRSLLGVDKTDE